MLEIKDEKFWGWVYDILCEECGADNYWRYNFISAMSDGCREYRFCGSLGFGGKLWNNNEKIYVNYYSEDRSDERDKTGAKANERLMALTTGYLNQ